MSETLRVRTVYVQDQRAANQRIRLAAILAGVLLVSTEMLTVIATSVGGAKWLAMLTKRGRRSDTQPRL